MMNRIEYKISLNIWLIKKNNKKLLKCNFAIN